MRQLAAEPKVRKVFGAGSLVCRARLWGGWLCSGVPGYGLTLLMVGLAPGDPDWEVQGFIVSMLVGMVGPDRAGCGTVVFMVSVDGSLGSPSLLWAELGSRFSASGLRSSGAGTSFLVVREDAQGCLGLVPAHWCISLVSRLVLAHWWIKLGPSMSDCWALNILRFMCLPSGGWGQGTGSPGADACPLMGGSCPLVSGAGSWDLWL